MKNFSLVAAYVWTTLAAILWMSPANAVWQESILLSDPPPQGTTISLIVDGDAIPATIKEDEDDDRLVVYFEGSGEQPESATIKVEPGNGEDPTTLPWDFTSGTILQISESGAASLALGSALNEAVAQNTHWFFAIHAHVGVYNTDAAESVSNRSSAEAVDLLNMQGVPGAAPFGEADDSGTSYGLGVAGGYQFANKSKLSLQIEQSRFDDLDGSAGASGNVGGISVDALSTFTNEIELLSASVNYYYPLTASGSWMVGGGLSYNQADRDDRFTSSAAINGIEQGSQTGGGSIDEESWGVNLGIEWRASNGFFAGFRYKRVDDLFEDEPFDKWQFDIGLRYQ